MVVTRPAAAPLRDFMRAKYGPDAAIDQALLVSGGLPGLTNAILSAATDHPLLPATTKARQLLAQPLYDRLAQLDELARDRALSLATLYILQQMAQVSLRSAGGTAAKVAKGAGRQL